MEIDYIYTNSDLPWISNENLGKAVKTIRILRRYPQDYVAKNIGSTINYISLLENGHRGASASTINKLAEVFKIPSFFIPLLATPPEGKLEEIIKKSQKKIYNYIKNNK